MVTGSSVIAFTYGEGVIIACDTLGVPFPKSALSKRASTPCTQIAVGNDYKNLILSVNGSATAASVRMSAAVGEELRVEKPNP
jgi:hypothetical protein